MEMEYKLYKNKKLSSNVNIDSNHKKEIIENSYKTNDIKGINFNNLKLDNIKIENIDCEELKAHFAESSFDSVVDINNMQSYHDYKKVIENIKYVLKDKGKLILLCRGDSSNILISQFYKIFYYTTMMKHGNDYTINWDEVFLKDKDFKVLYNSRKNYGKTYIYILELHKNKSDNI